MVKKKKVEERTRTKKEEQEEDELRRKKGDLCSIFLLCLSLRMKGHLVDPREGRSKSEWVGTGMTMRVGLIY